MAQSHSPTPSLKASEINRDWYLADASEANLGRLATEVSKKLIGKHKPTYSANIDNGDYVVVVNADKLRVTGNKLADKSYYRHSGYIGNIKRQSLEQKKLASSTRVVEDAVKGMLPKNKLQKGRLARLKVYAGAEHDHTAQKPVKLEVKG